VLARSRTLCQRQVGTQDGCFRSNKGMGGGCSRTGGVPNLVGRVEQRLLFEQGAGHRQQAVGDGAQGAAVAVANAEPEATYPRLLSAKGRCPPEEVGGTWGYAQYLEAMADPKHERHAEMVDWRGPDFDPNIVDEADIRKALTSFAKRRQRRAKANQG
jgi:Plasmid pRiA4b ORF-3-like protein